MDNNFIHINKRNTKATSHLKQQNEKQKQNFILSEQFENPIEKSQKEAKSLPPTFLAWYKHFNKNWQVNLVLWTQPPPPLSEMMRANCVFKLKQKRTMTYGARNSGHGYKRASYRIREHVTPRLIYYLDRIRTDRVFC